MDERAQKLIAAGRAVLPKLTELLGDDGKSMESELREALDNITVLPKISEIVSETLRREGRSMRSELREALDDDVDGATESWRAEAVRDILFQQPATRKYLEDAVPEAKSPRPFYGLDRRKWR